MITSSLLLVPPEPLRKPPGEVFCSPLMATGPAPALTRIPPLLTVRVCPLPLRVMFDPPLNLIELTVFEEMIPGTSLLRLRLSVAAQVVESLLVWYVLSATT